MYKDKLITTMLPSKSSTLYVILYILYVKKVQQFSDARESLRMTHNPVQIIIIAMVVMCM